MHELATLLPTDEESKRLVRNALDVMEAGKKCALIIGFDPEDGITIAYFADPHLMEQVKKRAEHGGLDGKS
jgi:hypothetical protein